ncbi:uncharacterized protein K452DRAFT_284558 [Aplosporella prunicola CBS 121167]|uniref:RCC1-like domain-containing protein n=1 Tax=Aplosporella prunicola CBS 121167 TaxID=1176127 RepID=A0A6A6BPL1_9PEZI|nr:uncharacterized protein K452DRAFT_284558 [Aplosporella prunicola CBS 121167]KAF2145174.1 hypothetical protein K452DRAFT_284558 [Aplosporella prunicola CBS 121167]
MLYAFGSNGSGQLGIGHEEDVSVPTEVHVQEDSTIVQPHRIAAGGNHTLVLTADNRMFATGDDSNGRCATGAVVQSSTQFRPGSLNAGVLPEPIIYLCACTWEASTFVSGDDVFTCGTGDKGELGQGGHLTHSTQPRIIIDFPPEGTRIVDMAACMDHTVVVLDNGEVYGWGNGRKGQLGEPVANVWNPRKITEVSFHAHRVACGREFTYIVGDPATGESLVLGSDKWSIKIPPVESIVDWVDIGASWSGIYVLLKSGKIVAWGRNDHGQLPAEGLPEIELMAVGSEHVLAKTREGKVVAWGWNEHGNCGTATDSKWNEVQVNDGTVKLLAAGCATSFVWTE